MKSSLLLAAAACMCISSAIAQNEKGYYVDSLGRYYQRADLPVYLYISTAPTDASAPHLLPASGYKAQPQPVPMRLEGHGKHVLRHQDADNPARNLNFEVYADGISPVSAAAFSGAPAFKRGETQFYGRGLSVVLSAKDEMSGVVALRFNYGVGEYNSYAQALIFDVEGEQHLEHYALDHVGNVEKTRRHTFTIDVSAPQTFHNITGIANDYLVSPATKMYLTVQDNIAGVAKTFYAFDDAPFKPYDGSSLPFTLLPDGEHTLKYYSTDNVQNQEAPKSFKFYYDRTAPMTVSDVLGDRFITNSGQVYFSGRTKLKLTSIDNKAGVKETRYSIDTDSFLVYRDPFYLPNRPGEHTVRFYAVDNLVDIMPQSDVAIRVPIETYKYNTSKVYVDIAGPIPAHSFVGRQFRTRDTMFVNPNTQIQLTANDPESGTQYIAYAIDGEQKETRYTQPFTLSKSGYHRVEMFGYDNVNNRNVGEFFCIVDGSAPQIFSNYSISPVGKQEGLDVYPPHVSVFLAATDDITGSDGIFYQLNSLPEKPYTVPINGFERGKAHTLRIRSVDKLGNESRTEIKFFVAK